jgi:hypothetical protein
VRVTKVSTASTRRDFLTLSVAFMSMWPMNRPSSAVQSSASRICVQHTPTDGPTRTTGVQLTASTYVCNLRRLQSQHRTHVGVSHLNDLHRYKARPLPHLHREKSHPATSAPGLGSVHLREVLLQYVRQIHELRNCD